MDEITITKKDFLMILRSYDEDRYESEPRNAISFVENIFQKMNIKKSQEEMEKIGSNE